MHKIPGSIAIAWRWLGVLKHFLGGWATVVFIFPFLDQKGRNLKILNWSQRLLKLLRVDLIFQGIFPSKVCIIAANHISWLDIFLILAVHPASFVSKSEIANWPMIGRLLKAAQTTLIERHRRKAVHEALQQMRHKLDKGLSVVFFPEGTTSDGSGLLPFHANLFEVAMQAKTKPVAPPEAVIPLIPTAIRYLQEGEICFHAAYIGDTTLLQSIHTLITSGPLQAQVQVCKPLFSNEFTTRHALSKAAHLAIDEALRKYS
ncbi:MAG: 1-acyl-sn-glycerol-3-phosphate acyltransferase [Burkholderiaceae bacterium]|nr:1-acyl-sn-glycerol-3-phosphate acyltransferase [Burkholderiaceae bacterium]